MTSRRHCLGTLGGAALWASLGLSGCASKARTNERIWSGRLAVTVHDTPTQTLAASFELQGNPDAGQLTLYSPLGTTMALVQWSGQGAQWQRGSEWENWPTLQALTTELTGTALPVEELFAWLQGQSTQTQGWQVDLVRHAEGRITAQRQSPLPRAELRVIFEP